MTAESIESLLNGSVQLLITSVPITGNFFVSARQLSITALFDLQKDQHKVPYLRIATCDKAKELITSTICETISDTIRERVNLVLRRMPRAISVAKIISSFVSSDSDDRSSSPPIAAAEQKEVPTLLSGGWDKFGKNSKEHFGHNGTSSARRNSLSAECPTDFATSFLDLLDMHSLGQVFIDLDFLDSSAGSDFFAVGISGNVFMDPPVPMTNVNTELLGDVDKLETDQQQPKNNRRRTKAPPPPMLRFPGVGLNGYQRKAVEMIISEFSVNEALLQAFRYSIGIPNEFLKNFKPTFPLAAKMMKVRLGPNSAVFGQMLRTICGSDEVCLSDFVKDSVTVHLVGNATIFLSQNGKSIGRIPFESVVELGMARNSSSKSQSATTKLDETAADNTTATTGTHGKIMDVSLSIPTLALRGDAFDFFGLSPQTVESFLNTVRNAIQNTAGKALSSGVSLIGLEKRLCPYGISQPDIQLLNDGLVLLNAELDAYVLLFDSGGIGTQQKQQQKRRHCSPTEL
ncbi:hypothetical protein niasHT_010145 [Heterodera trifolii]|uniref:Uncharacterized protein n=1 Tax=Heterodera trifolii TaxID=157864 RepID=A0ABD2LZ89_9BILA